MASERLIGHDGAGNIVSDTRSGTAYGYTYNARNRLDTVSVAGVTQAAYTYNGLEQLAIRVAIAGTPGTTHYLHDLFGNVIAETDGTGAAGTVREVVWLPETEISPTMGSRTTVDRPLAVVDGVDTTPVTWWVHVDHLNRPIKMTDGAKAAVWTAVWAPWGAPSSITGTATLDARFPGQWFQLEAGLHYNWHRHYDPSLGRYTQPDPLGFVDGPGVFAYALNNPISLSDTDGLLTGFPQSKPPQSQVQQCGLKDYCKNVLKNAKTYRGKAQLIVIACLSYLGSEEGPSPPQLPPRDRPRIEGPAKPGPPKDPPKDPPPAPGSTHDTGQSTLP